MYVKLHQSATFSSPFLIISFPFFTISPLVVFSLIIVTASAYASSFPSSTIILPIIPCLFLPINNIPSIYSLHSSLDASWEISFPWTVNTCIIIILSFLTKWHSCWSTHIILLLFHNTNSLTKLKFNTFILPVPSGTIKFSESLFIANLYAEVFFITYKCLNLFLLDFFRWC